MITLVSYGGKYGKIDRTQFKGQIVRKLNLQHHIRNPYKFKDLRKKTGLDPEVQQFVARCRGFNNLLGMFVHYPNDRVLAVNCYGGKHRSVAFVEALAEKIRTMRQLEVTVIHRDVHK